MKTINPMTLPGDICRDNDDPIGIGLTSSKIYLWKPVPDITAYELALAMPLFMATWHTDVEKEIQRLPENVRRHFEPRG